MQKLPNARELLQGLLGRTITTLRNRPNTVLALTDGEVVVGTTRSPAGERIPIDEVEAALQRLGANGQVELSVASLGYRSSFVGAVLLTLPGVAITRTSPPRISLSDAPDSTYRAQAAAVLNAWWKDDNAERFWLEITDRPDIGVDLHCPQRDARGNPTPGYSLIWWVRYGDIIFHYDLNQHAITSWSRAVGNVVEGPVIWLSHRGATRRRLASAVPQPGWWLDLEGPYQLSEPLTLHQLRARSAAVRTMMDQLRQRTSGALYFPFYLYGGAELRPMQPYLNKLPASFVNVFDNLSLEAHAAAVTEPMVGAGDSTSQVGTEYRFAKVSSVSTSREPFSIDPAIIERGLRGHALTQNALAKALRAAGAQPLSPQPGDPNFDLAWDAHGTLFVAEVKSITPDNEERQLRLGLGQVLRYQNLLAEKGRVVKAVLVAEKPPADPSWESLCQQLGVLLVSPQDFERVAASLDEPRPSESLAT